MRLSMHQHLNPCSTQRIGWFHSHKDDCQPWKIQLVPCRKECQICSLKVPWGLRTRKGTPRFRLDSLSLSLDGRETSDHQTFSFYSPGPLQSSKWLREFSIQNRHLICSKKVKLSEFYSSVGFQGHLMWLLIHRNHRPQSYHSRVLSKRYGRLHPRCNSIH